MLVLKYCIRRWLHNWYKIICPQLPTVHLSFKQS